MSLNDIFDVRKLDDHEIGHLEYVLNSPSYARVFRPYLERMRDSLIHRLLDPTAARKADYPDDFIRGGVAMVTGLSQFFDKLVEETQIARVQAARANNPEDKYHQDLAEGRVSAAGQVYEEEQPLEDQ